MELFSVAEPREVLAYALLGSILVVTPVIYLVCIIYAKLWLKQAFTTLLETGLTRKEVRLKLRKLPIVWEIKLLVWLKYKEVNEQSLQSFLKLYSEYHFGTEPETASK